MRRYCVLPVCTWRTIRVGAGLINAPSLSILLVPQIHTIVTDQIGTVSHLLRLHPTAVAYRNPVSHRVV